MRVFISSERGFVRRISRMLALSIAMSGASLGLGGVETAAAGIPQIVRVAVVDMQRVLNETRAGKRARTELEKSSAVKQGKLDKHREALEADQAKLATLGGSALAQAQEKLQHDYYELQRMYTEMQQTLAEHEARTLEKVYRDCQGLTATMAKDFGLNLVLIRDQSTVLYTDASIDLTNEVIARYDRKYP